MLPTPAPGFDEPLEALLACHERIRRLIATLEKLPEHLSRAGADGEAKRAAGNLLRYFDHSAPHHHADEEVDLFPRMALRATGEDARKVSVICAGLRDEHVAMDQAWGSLRVALGAVAEGRRPEALEPPALDAANFVARYRRHMAKEEDELLPLARRLLQPEDLQAMGEAMAARRGLPPPGSGG
jgi:hemerythrin-like domain-containing protein